MTNPANQPDSHHDTPERHDADSSPPGAHVELSGVTRRYGKADAAITAVDDVTLNVTPGEAVALMGPSGSGKSTLLHLVGAMDRPTAGRVVVDGTDVAALSRPAAAAYRRRVGFVFQRFHLLTALSALDNVLAPLLPSTPDPTPPPKRWICSPRSASAAGNAPRPPSSPAANSNEWRSPGH